MELREIVAPFTFATPNLNAGLPVYQPAIGDRLMDAWVDIATAFDGTTPQMDIGLFTGAQTTGILKTISAIGSPWDLTIADNDPYAGGNGLDGFANTSTVNPTLATAVTNNAGASQSNRDIPLTFVAGPLRFVVSQDGTVGGTAIGGAAGAATLHLLILPANTSS